MLPIHRIYAGRYVSGIVQIGWVTATSLWVWIAYKGLLVIVNSSPLTMDKIMDMGERVSDWKEKNHPSLIPALALLAASIWVAIDAARLVAGKFTDSQGLKITHWI